MKEILIIMKVILIIIAVLLSILFLCFVSNIHLEKYRAKNRELAIAKYNLPQEKNDDITNYPYFCGESRMQALREAYKAMPLNEGMEYTEVVKILGLPDVLHYTYDNPKSPRRKPDGFKCFYTISEHQNYGSMYDRN